MQSSGQRHDDPSHFQVNMKQLPRACCLLLALAVTACSSVPAVEKQLRRIDIGADTYVVRAGDTLESIAFRYRLTPNELAALNPGAGRHFATGTHLNVRAATLGRERYRSDAELAGRQPDTTRNRIPDQAVTSPVYRPRAVPDRTDEPGLPPSLLAPAVGAVVSDMNLLDPGRPYMRQGVLVPEHSYPYEVVEEEYTGGRDIVNIGDVNAGLQPLLGRWIWPTDGKVARGFSPVEEGRHGVDIAGLPGQPVVAALDGRVAYSGRDPSGSGNLIIVKHKDSLLTAYSHTRDLYVAEDDTVKAGDPIGTLGWNAQQESVLRFEVRQNGNSLNPLDFLATP